MKPRLILNLALIIAVSALILFVIYGPNKSTKPVYTSISNIALDTITRIEVQYKNKQKVLISKNDSSWFIQHPFEYAANEFQVLSLLSIAKKDSYTTIDVKNNELGKYGLDKPTYTLTLDNNTFSFGTTDPLKFKRYVRFNNSVHLIDDEKYRFLSQEPVKFSSKSLLPSQKTIVKITTNNFSLHRNKQQWRLTPENIKISADEKNRLIDAWSHAQAQNVSRIDKIANSGLQTVTIDFEDKTQLSFHLVETQDQLFFIRNDLGLKIELNKNNKEDLLILHTDKNPAVVNTTDG